VFDKLPADAIEIPNSSGGAKLNSRLFIWNEQAHSIVDKSPEPENVETELVFDDAGTKFCGRRKKEPSEEILTETLQEVISAPPEPTRPQFADNVRQEWLFDSERFRSTPPEVTLVETIPATVERSGVVSERNEEKRYFFVSDSETGCRFFVHYSSAIKLKNHFCLFASGTPVLFEIVTGEPDGGRAFNVTLQNPPELPEIEFGVVCHWNEKGYGFARRACGCEMFLSSDHVTTLGTLAVNSEIQFRPIAQPGNRFTATDIRIFQPDPEPTVFGQALAAALRGETCNR
jgi:cold shock CspA family protein